MKKTEILTIRITEDTKNKLKAYAKEKEWSLAYTANRILETAIKNAYSNPDQQLKERINIL